MRQKTTAPSSWDTLMRAGRFAEAWAESDIVLQTRDPATRDNPALPYHLRWVWDGTPPDGRHVLVRCYHGLGDTLQFVRFLPMLRTRARSVTLEVQPALRELLRQVAGADQIVPFDVARPSPPGACDVEIMELGHMLRVRPQEVSGCLPYLSPPGPVPEWARGRVGLCWRAGDWDPGRSVALPDLLAALGEQPPFVSLQRGPAAEQANSALFANPHDSDMDMVRTAALIAGCSRVVTVDTAVAHLAGALGLPGLVLLKEQPDWRWAAFDGRAVWYPSLHLARLPSPA